MCLIATCLAFSLSFDQAVAEAQTPFDIDPDDLDGDDFICEVDFEGAYTYSIVPDSPMVDLSDSLEAISSDSDNASIALFTPKQTPTVKHPLVQTKLPFQPIPISEWRAQESRRYHEQQEEREQEAERSKLAEAKRMMEQRKRDRMRKRAEHARQKDAKQKLLLLNKTQNTTNQVRKFYLITVGPREVGRLWEDTLVEPENVIEGRFNSIYGLFFC
jgi:hypothetical protein